METFGIPPYVGHGQGVDGGAARRAEFTNSVPSASIPANRLLMRSGTPVPLTSKLFDLLCCFVEQADRLLTKDEILAQVWSGTFVEEGNLARHVSLLRKQLGEGPKDHVFIVTVPGQGYRFVARVTTVLSHDGPWPAALVAVAPVASADAANRPAAVPEVEARPGQALDLTSRAAPQAARSAPRHVAGAIGVAAVLAAVGWFAWSRPAAVTGVVAPPPTLRVDVDLWNPAWRSRRRPTCTSAAAIASSASVLRATAWCSWPGVGCTSERSTTLRRCQSSAPTGPRSSSSRQTADGWRLRPMAR